MAAQIDKSVPPWTPEQVDALNAYQRSGKYHPFTCPGDLDCTERNLIARPDGWVCACGEYTQDWAHRYMAIYQEQGDG